MCRSMEKIMEKAVKEDFLGHHIIVFALFSTYGFLFEVH